MTRAKLAMSATGMCAIARSPPSADVSWPVSV
jgi:hypothetical protein